MNRHSFSKTAARLCTPTKRWPRCKPNWNTAYAHWAKLEGQAFAVIVRRAVACWLYSSATLPIFNAGHRQGRGLWPRFATLGSHWAVRAEVRCPEAHTVHRIDRERIRLPFHQTTI